MTKFALTLLAAATVAAPALAGTTLEFTRDGIAYVAQIENKNGAETIVGHEVQSGRAFSLVVVDGRVSGTYDEFPVNYATPRAQAATVRTASR